MSVKRTNQIESFDYYYRCEAEGKRRANKKNPNKGKNETRRNNRAIESTSNKKNYTH